MNIDPALVQLLTGNTIQQQQQMDNKWGAYKPILEAQKQTLTAVPSEDKFNGIIDPGDVPNSLYYDPDSFVSDLATKQSMEQPDYLPPIPENLYDPNWGRMDNMLRLLENYQKWKQGESP